MIYLFEKGYLSCGEMNGRVTSVRYQVIYLCTTHNNITSLILIYLSWQRGKALLDEISVPAKSFLFK